MMMRTMSSHKIVNRMSCSAVAACMAPLLLRPLLAGECEIDNDFDVGGDGSVQLLQAAAAANHAQAIVITLLDEYDKIFGLKQVLTRFKGLELDLYQGIWTKMLLMKSLRIRERKESVTVLLCGTSGCGKSTLSALLGSRLGITTVISTDSIRYMMRSFVDEKQNPLLW